MAMTTALGFLTLGVATVCASGNDSIPLRLWAGPSTFSYLLRFLVPLTAAATLLGGFLVPRVTMLLGVNPAFTASVTVVLAIVVTAIMSASIARHIAVAITRAEAVRDKAMNSLRESEDRYRAVAEDMPAMICRFLPGGEITFVNEAYGKHLNKKPEELIGSDFLSLIPEANRDAVMASISALTVESPTQTQERSLPGPNGDIRWQRWTNRVMFDPQGNTVAYQSIGEDITERKEAEKEREDLIAKLEAQNAELERFTYTVSHDLKSPLITITGYVGMLRQDLALGDSKSVADDLACIASAAEKMNHLLKDLLELSRIGRLVNPPEEVPLEELAREACELAGGQLSNSGVQVEIAPDLPVVFGDRLRLLEVLQNLIDNAVKYMGDQSQPRVEVGSRRDGDETVCYVRDNGVGIDPRYHGRVFGLFDQLDPKVEGSGIGLALVKRIVEVHGGRIWIESEGSGRGSTFCFTLAEKSGSQDVEPCGTVGDRKRSQSDGT